MICPNCGQNMRGSLCAYCGTTLKRKQAGLLIIAIVLAVIIAASVVVVFVVPSEKPDIGSTVQTYLTAAFYANKVVDTADGYSSYSTFKRDIDVAMDACRALTGDTGFLARGDMQLIRTAYATDALDGLDTDADSGFYGGYTDDAADAVRDITADMQRDAQTALRALEHLDDKVKANTDDEALADSCDDAKDALGKADNVAVVVGSKEVSFAGIKTLGSINTALVGADIVIDGSTAYLGADDAVLFACTGIGTEVAVINGSGGIMMDIGNINVVQEGGSNVAIMFDGLREPPESMVFGTAAAFVGYISDEISGGIGFDPDEGNDIDVDLDEGNDITDGQDTMAGDSGSGVYIDDPTVVGTWQYTDALISPWVALNEMEESSAEFMIDIHKQPSEIMMYPGQAVAQYMIFRADGTGVLYYDVEDEGIVMPMGFWWREDTNGDILVVGEVTVGYTFEWNDHLRGIMQNFQNGDYSDFESISLMRIRKRYIVNITYLYQFLSGEEDAHVCIEYSRVSNATDFDFGN